MKYHRLSQQPPVVEIVIADEIFIKQMYIAKADTYVPQHSHRYEHASMVAVGAVEVWRDDEYMGTYWAPSAITIAAGVKHRFRAKVDGTLVYCIHNIARTGEVEILAEHQLAEG